LKKIGLLFIDILITVGLTISGCRGYPKSPIEQIPTNPAPTRREKITSTSEDLVPKYSTIEPQIFPTRQEPFLPSIQIAKADLAQRLNVDIQSINLVNVQADEFSAGDLGCPAPGETPRPIPAFVSGITILLESNGGLYIYRAAKDQVVYCGEG